MKFSASFFTYSPWSQEEFLRAFPQSWDSLPVSTSSHVPTENWFLAWKNIYRNIPEVFFEKNHIHWQWKLSRMSRKRINFTHFSFSPRWYFFSPYKTARYLNALPTLFTNDIFCTRFFLEKIFTQHLVLIKVQPAVSFAVLRLKQKNWNLKAWKKVHKNSWCVC